MSTGARNCATCLRTQVDADEDEWVPWCCAMLMVRDGVDECEMDQVGQQRTDWEERQRPW